MTDLTPEQLLEQARQHPMAEEADILTEQAIAALDAERARVEAVIKAAQQRGHFGSGRFHDSRCSLCIALAAFEIKN